jgi:hypothetical protein
MEPERLFGPEHLAGSNTKQKRVTNLSGGTRDSDFNRSFHDAISHKHAAGQSRSKRRSFMLKWKRACDPKFQTPRSKLQRSSNNQAFKSRGVA